MLNKKAIVTVFTKRVEDIFDIGNYEIFKVTSQGLGDLLLRLSQEEYDEILIQPITIIEGMEYTKIKETALIYQGQFNCLRIGKPLLGNKSDQTSLLSIMKEICIDKKKDQGVIWVGHGSSKSYGETYKSLSKIMELSLERELLITLNDLLDLSNCLTIVESWKVNEIIIRPFFLVSGNHYLNEVVSDNVDSLKSKLKEMGYVIHVSYRGLLSYRGIMNMYKEKICQEE